MKLKCEMSKQQQQQHLPSQCCCSYFLLSQDDSRDSQTCAVMRSEERDREKELDHTCVPGVFLELMVLLLSSNSVHLQKIKLN